MVLHRLAWRGTAAPDGTLLTAKGVLRGLASRLAISARAGDRPPGRPNGGLLTLDRLAGEVVMPPDEPRRCIPAPQGQHKAPGYLAPARVSRRAGSRRMGGLAACLVSRGGHDRHRDAAGRGCVAA